MPGPDIPPPLPPAMPSPQPNVGASSARGFGRRFWLALILSSAATGLAAGALMKLLYAVQRLAWGAGRNGFLHAVQDSSATRRILILLAAAGIVIGSRLALRLRGSAHGGELSAAIWFRAGRLPPLPTLLNAVTSIVIVGLGASLGREAAPKQTGALFAGLLAQWGGLPPAERRLLAACGAGAGIAAVYNVPFGGALFALEVLLGALSLGFVAPAVTASFIATACAWLLLPNTPTYALPRFGVSPALLGWSIAAGPLLGLAAVAYVRLIVWADAHKPAGWQLAAAPVGALLLLGVLSLRYPLLLGNGKDAVQLAITGGIPLLLAAVLALLKPLMTAACLGAGAPGGLFTPTLTLGALLGAAGGQAFLLAWPSAHANAGAYALVGGAALLAASTQGPVSAIVLVLELTRRADALMVPLLAAVAGASLVARWLESRSIYSGRIHTGRLAALLSDHAGLPADARAPEMLPALTRAPDRTLTVLDENGAALGSLCLDKALSGLESSHAPAIATARDFIGC